MQINQIEAGKAESKEKHDKISLTITSILLNTGKIAAFGQNFIKIKVELLIINLIMKYQVVYKIN
jgi:hypothetical protein